MGGQVQEKVLQNPLKLERSQRLQFTEEEPQRAHVPTLTTEYMETLRLRPQQMLENHLKEREERVGEGERRGRGRRQREGGREGGDPTTESEPDTGDISGPPTLLHES